MCLKTLVCFNHFFGQINRSNFSVVHYNSDWSLPLSGLQGERRSAASTWAGGTRRVSRSRPRACSCAAVRAAASHASICVPSIWTYPTAHTRDWCTCQAAAAGSGCVTAQETASCWKTLQVFKHERFCVLYNCKLVELSGSEEILNNFRALGFI